MTTQVLGGIALVGIFLFALLMAYEDGIPLGFIYKLKCKFGLHKHKNYKVNKYYCQSCKKPRSHPELKVLDGGNKLRHNIFKF